MIFITCVMICRYDHLKVNVIDIFWFTKTKTLCRLFCNQFSGQLVFYVLVLIDGCKWNGNVT